MVLIDYRRLLPNRDIPRLVWILLTWCLVSLVSPYFALACSIPHQLGIHVDMTENICSVICSNSRIINTCSFLFRGVISSSLLLLCSCVAPVVEAQLSSPVSSGHCSVRGFMGACAALIHDRSWNCWETTTDSLLLALRDVSWISAHHCWTVTCMVVMRRVCLLCPSFPIV